MADEEKITTPKAGEETLSQTLDYVWNTLFGDTTYSGNADYNTYRKMKCNPTIALARSLTFAPIKLANYSIVGDDENLNNLVKTNIDELWPDFIRDVLLAVDYGFQSFEKIWEVKTIDGTPRLVYGKLKPLNPDKTQVMLDKDNPSVFAGLKQGQVKLPPEKCFWYVNDGEFGNWYGKSRHENVREDAWGPWLELVKKYSNYIKKVAAVTPIIRYPAGQSQDATGTLKSNFDIAQALLRKLGEGHGIAMPQEIASYAADLFRSGIKPEDLYVWQVKFMESGSAHGYAFVAGMKHYESLMMRGWMIPERAATEGQYGTKAEAENSTNLALLNSELLLDDIIRQVNHYIIDPLLRYNYGEKATGKTKIEKAGIDANSIQYIRSIIKEIMVNPQNVDMVRSFIDLKTMVEQSGLPESNEEFDDGDIENESRKIAQGIFNSGLPRVS